MNDHYYSRKPLSNRDLREININIFGRQFVFETDSGIFSRAALDYGSRLLLETFEVDSEQTVLDLGCGYGAMGIILANMNPTLKVTMVDINERAVELSNININHHKASNVNVMQSDGFESLDNQKFDAIICNPPIRVGKEKIYNMFRNSKKYLNQTGKLWIVIRKQQGAKAAFKELTDIFREVDITCMKKGYAVIRSCY